MDLQTTLILGGYGFSSLVAGFMWREMVKMRQEVERLRLDIARRDGLEVGYNHEHRITRLERICQRLGHTTSDEL